MSEKIRIVEGFEIKEYVGYQTTVSPYSDSYDQQGCCTSCVHKWDNSSDIFGECGGCMIQEKVSEVEKALGVFGCDEWSYFNTEAKYICPLWVGTPKGIDNEAVS